MGPYTKKVLVISYLFPPIGGSGSLRPLRLARHLPQHGWEPLVLTVKNPDWYYANDPELLDDLPPNVSIFRASMLRSTWIYRCLNPLRIKGIDKLIRLYLFHPDEQIGWLPFAYSKAFRIIQNHKIAALYSTSGPLTSHLIALFLKRRFGIPWVAEFRDEWFEDPALPMPTMIHKRFHFHLEKLIVTEANKIVTLAPELNAFLMKHTVLLDKFHTIPIGIEDDQLKVRLPKASQKQFTVVYAGLIYDTFPPDRFLKAVNELVKEEKIPAQELRIRFIGAITINPVLDPFGIVECTGFMSRSKALEEEANADLLLLLLSRERGKGIIPSKIFEYMVSGNPILALVPREGAAAEIIERTNTGTVVDFYNTGKIKQTFLTLYERWKNGTLNPSPNWEEVNKYRQTILFRNIADILDELEKDTLGQQAEN